MKQHKLIITISLMILFSLILISSQGVPSIQKTVTGYEIQAVDPDVLKQNTSYTFSFHVFNFTNSYPILDNNTRCDFHLYNQTGKVMMSYNQIAREPSTGVSNEWEININQFNTSTLGTYHYIFQCNNTLRSLGGWWGSNFEVTTSGRTLMTNEAILYFQYFLLLCLVSIVFFILAFAFSQNKTIFIPIFFLSMGIIVLVINFGYIINIINNYQENFFYLNSIFQTMFYVLALLTTAGGIAVVVGLIADSMTKFMKLRYG
jgi:hypothetical protein